MPETLACVFIAVVSVGIYLFARTQPIGVGSIEDERQRLSREIAWLEERLERAENEGWQADMHQPLIDRLKQTRREAALLASRG